MTLSHNGEKNALTRHQVLPKKTPSTKSLHYSRVPALSVTPTTQQQSYVAEHTTHCIATQGKWTVSTWKLASPGQHSVLESTTNLTATDPGTYNKIH